MIEREPQPTSPEQTGKDRPPSRSAAIADLQRSYYRGELPRAAAVAHAELILGVSRDQALRLFLAEPAVDALPASSRRPPSGRALLAWTAVGAVLGLLAFLWIPVTHTYVESPVASPVATHDLPVYFGPTHPSVHIEARHTAAPEDLLFVVFQGIIAAALGGFAGLGSYYLFRAAREYI
jgi:hypothetical protein